MWPDDRLLKLLNIEHPIIQAPMAGASGTDLAVAVARAGGLGSLPCAMSSPDRVRADIGVIRQQTDRPVNMNFFCHRPGAADPDRQTAWLRRLAQYYEELGLDLPETLPATPRAPFDEAMCEAVQELRPEAVSFHFGLPAENLVRRVKAAGVIILSSATTVTEARWLQDHGCDVIIAQGYEAGGHRAMFLSSDIATQPGTLALVPQVVDATDLPVVAAGGIADGRGIAAAFALGASGVQVGTGFLLTPESLISDLHRNALSSAGDDRTALTNVFSGRPARGIVNRVMREVGPMSDLAPDFPTAGNALAPLRASAEPESADFSSLWSGQAAGLARSTAASDLTRQLASEALAVLRSMAGTS